MEGLPFLTVLCPSERYAAKYRHKYKLLTDWAKQVALQIVRWLPDRHLVMVADSGFAAIDLLKALRTHLCVITRLRLDARLFDPPRPRSPHQVGRPAVVGKRQPALQQRLTDPATPWRQLTVTGWYGTTERTVEITAGTAIWHHPGRYVPIAYVLVRDCQGELRPQAFLATDTNIDPVDLLRWFIRRWSVEVTFAEGTPTPWRRDAAAVDRQGDRSHHAMPAGTVLASGVVGRRHATLSAHHPDSALVPQTAADLC